jgi:hypothetical protein
MGWNKGLEKFRRVAGALLLATVMGLGACGLSYGQTFAEWFRQKSTQKRYLLQQIAALQVYGGYLEEGYRVAGSGLETIRGFSHGEFALHSAFRASLKTVNPAILHDPKAGAVLQLQLAISKAFSAADRVSLPPYGAAYVAAVKAQVIAECVQDLEELRWVLSSGRLAMRDGERTERLNRVYLAMRDKAAFTQSFYNRVALLAGQRAAELRSARRLKDLLGKEGANEN